MIVPAKNNDNRIEADLSSLSDFEQGRVSTQTKLESGEYEIRFNQIVADKAPLMIALKKHSLLTTVQDWLSKQDETTQLFWQESATVRIINGMVRAFINDIKGVTWEKVEEVFETAKNIERNL